VKLEGVEIWTVRIRFGSSADQPNIVQRPGSVHCPGPTRTGRVGWFRRTAEQRGERRVHFPAKMVVGFVEQFKVHPAGGLCNGQPAVPQSDQPRASVLSGSASISESG